MTELDFAQLKYVLYARKSTDDPKRQLRSIPDQIAECLELADRLHLNVVNRKNPLTETKSAKAPNRRPVFSQLLTDLRNGKYDGILAWNPDRLARNMLEAGLLIDMADTGVIKDFKFVTHVYSPDANGKMLLGMAFVLSKQYSDKLSQDVTRGVRSRLEEGKTPTPKHGYINEDGTYKPDGHNYELICDAWQMRLEDKSIEDITAYLNQEGYTRVIKKTGKSVDMDKRILSKIFHDPFYYGVLIQADQQVDLRLLPNYNFQPAVKEKDFFTIQDLTYHKMRPSKPHKNVFYPLRGLVFCHFCNRPCVVAPSTGHSKRYLYYRCDNPDCTRKKRSIRAKFVFNFIYDFLADGLNLTEKEYHDYYDNLIKLTDEKRQGIRTQLHTRQGLLKHAKQELNERSLKILDYEENTPIYKANDSRIAVLDDEVAQLSGEITKLQEQLRESETDRLTIEQFLNLSKKAGTIVKSANELQKDIICREIFLNFSVDEQKVSSYRLKEPFATLLKQRQVLPSRDGET